jgi:hypothetical protein
MAAPFNAAAVAALADVPVDWRFKGLPTSWSGRTAAEICADLPGAIRRRRDGADMCAAPQ